ncbi:hypothetical protein SAMN02745181_3219 [Rubritalea squalenifaciens DSM 18772]|uniref:NADAR domain-containing protein n=1 Tax=Rubritalea squalenifaciens DSM 18772 TaxID=1123071 RepID=A0A1M6PKP0_9BACT|nr:NADAR family protein [Rubritalea squalenifaciens]SHK08491.1 hypothetical protein SAMN02745181_3219 [Rubritalea squalenifaciens DSM 18772]
MQPSLSVSDLIVRQQAGERLKYLFFWGHTPPADGSITKACFSQWWFAPFDIEDTLYPTAEHYMMATKARLFGDEAMLAKILTSSHPKQAKDFGRQISNFDESLWLQHRYRIVYEANLAKFSQHSKLREFILNTGNRILVEASPVDKIWGIGLAADDTNAEHPAKWKGLNLLGFALMDVRTALQK